MSKIPFLMISAPVYVCKEMVILYTENIIYTSTKEVMFLRCVNLFFLFFFLSVFAVTQKTNKGIFMKFFFMCAGLDQRMN